MCRNNSECKVRRSGFWNILVFTILFSILITINPAYAETSKITLLFGDTNTKTTIEAVKAIHKEYPKIKDRVTFQIYPSKGIKEKDLDQIRESDLILINIHGRQLANAVKNELKEAIRNGSAVYNTGPTYDEDHKEMGIIVDKKFTEYFDAHGYENMKSLLLYVVNKEFGLEVSFSGPVETPDHGIYEHKTKNIYESFTEFKKGYSSFRPGRPWIGVVLYKYAITVKQTKTVDTVIEKLETEGYNVLSVYGWPPETALSRFFLDSNGKSRVRLIVGMGLKMGIKPGIIGPVLDKLNVPLISAITLYSLSWSRLMNIKSGFPKCRLH